MALLLPAIDALAQEDRPTIVVPRIGGKELFIYCALCHKLDGSGGATEGGYAANLRKTQLTHDELVSVITNGRREKGMPPFDGILDEQKISTLAKYIKEELRAEE